VETKFGYSLVEWQAAKDEVVAILGDRVRRTGKTIAYGDLCDKDEDDLDRASLLRACRAAGRDLLLGR
jgi:hypothetical protein